METAVTFSASTGSDYKPLIWILPIVASIVVFSCVDGNLFMQDYKLVLQQFPISDSWVAYLSRNYKIGHPICYAILALVTTSSLRSRYLFTILALFSLGAALEGIQYFLPTRGPSLIDMVYNLSGILVGAGIVWVLRRGLFELYIPG